MLVSFPYLLLIICPPSPPAHILACTPTGRHTPYVGSSSDGSNDGRGSEGEAASGRQRGGGSEGGAATALRSALLLEVPSLLVEVPSFLVEVPSLLVVVGVSYNAAANEITGPLLLNTAAQRLPPNDSCPTAAAERLLPIDCLPSAAAERLTPGGMAPLLPHRRNLAHGKQQDRVGLPALLPTPAAARPGGNAVAHSTQAHAKGGETCGRVADVDGVWLTWTAAPVRTAGGAEAAAPHLWDGGRGMTHGRHHCCPADHCSPVEERRGEEGEVPLLASARACSFDPS
ncbi:unnamed protein product [Closterium sp. Naga37s-1]|nr:unnamed protein product [Closterium sp. Naga37s-1]